MIYSVWINLYEVHSRSLACLGEMTDQLRLQIMSLDTLKADA